MPSKFSLKIAIVILFTLQINFGISQNIDLFVQKTHYGDIKEVKFSPSGKYFATKGYSEIFIWETKTMKQIVHSKDLPSGCKIKSDFFFSNNDQFIYMTEDKKVRILDLETFKIDSSRFNNRLSYFENNFIIVQNYETNKDVVFSSKNLQKLDWINPYDRYIRGRISDGPLFYIQKGSNLEIYDTIQKKEIANIKIDNYDNWYRYIRGFCDNYTALLVEYSNKGKVKIVKYNLKSGRKKTVVSEKEGLYFLAFNETSNYLAMSNKEVLRIIDVENSEIVLEKQGDYKNDEFWFSGKGRYCIHYEKYDMGVADLKTKKTWKIKDLHTCIFSPDDKYLLISRGESKLRLYSKDNFNEPFNEFKSFDVSSRFEILPEFNAVRFGRDGILNLTKFDIKIDRKTRGQYLGNYWFLKEKNNNELYKYNYKTGKKTTIYKGAKWVKWYKSFGNGKKYFVLKLIEPEARRDSIYEVDFNKLIDEKHGKNISKIKKNALLKELREEYDNHPDEGKYDAFGLYVLNLENGVLKPLNFHQSIFEMGFMPDLNNENCLILSKDTFHIINFENPDLRYKVHKDEISKNYRKVSYMKDMKLYYFFYERLYSYSILEKKVELIDTVRNIKPGSNLFFNHDHNYIVTKTSENTIKIYNINGFSLRHTIKTPKLNKELSIRFDPNLPRFYVFFSDFRRICYDAETGKELFTILSDGKEDFIISLPEGYYASTSGALKYVSFKLNNKLYNFEQFDLILNRPDKVFERIGMTDPNLLKTYKKAYSKRINKMGFDVKNLTLTSELPEVKLAEDLPLETDSQKITVKINAIDNKSGINRINIYVNNVPIFGKKGYTIEKNTFRVNTSYELELSNGMNKIQVSALNNNGLESYMVTQNVFNKTKTTKPDLYLISIGVSDFNDDNFDLTYAAKDAVDFSNAFDNQSNTYNNIYKTVLTNSDVSISKVKEIKDKLLNTKVNDKVILFVASHGLLDNELNYYIGTPDIDFANPATKGLPYEELENLLDGIPARNKLLLIDACHSGEVDKEESELVDAEISKDDNNVHFRGFKKVKQKNNVGLENSFELMQELFTDIRRGTGAVIIASAGGGEFAYESSEWNNGVFTYAVINALNGEGADKNKNNKLDIKELRDFVFSMVSELTVGKQNPTTRKDNIDNNFDIWE